MSVAHDPTPCPQPRFPQRHRPTGLATLSEESAPSPPRRHQNLLRDAKPRRPVRKARTSAAWDPTVDIYDDTFAFKAEPPAAAAAAAAATDQPLSRQPQQGTARSYAQPLNRRTSLLAQPAQKLPLDADTKRRRVSAVPEQPHAPAPVSAHTKPASHQPFLNKDPRRRTIYVPSEDTTVMTIHPGASFRDSNSLPRKPRRSDLFLDLASTMQPDTDHTTDLTMVKKAPRKSLSVAPRKAPLQPATRSVQPSMLHTDVAGTGGGKENLPPGTEQHDSYKPDEDNTCLLKVSARRISIAPAKDKPLSPKRRLSVASQRHEPLSARDVNSPGRVAVAKGSAARPAPMAAPLALIPNQGLSNSSSSVNPQKRVSMGPALHTRSSNVDSVPPSKLSVPLLSQYSRRATSIYPTIAEHVPHSEMYEDNWLSNQEAAIGELINRLFESAGCDRGNTVLQTNSPTLQRDLIGLYHDPAVVLLHKRLKASLQFGALGIPKETLSQVCRFRDDMQQRQRFLDLWTKTFNLKSLQAAAEVVVGREVPVNPRLSSSPPRTVNSESNGVRNRNLEAFLKSFLLRNEDGLQRSATSFSTSFNNYEDDAVDDTGSNGWLWRRTIIRSLMIILLLDRAQKAGLFKECLFQPTSPFKSSTAVVQALGNLLLPSIGNVYRVLEHLSYHVQHVQYPLEEQHYHINNLAVDLRDGVLLTRLIEILLYPPSSLDLAQQNITVTLPGGDVLTSAFQASSQNQWWPLSQHLKYPCLSRVQKVYNVQIALSALAGVKDFSTVLITPEDIVDGHREKSIGLLWSIVGRWGLDALVDFDLVEREIRRLDKRWAEVEVRRLQASSLSSSSNYNEIAEDPAFHYSTGLEHHTLLLKTWAQKAARLHGVKISNLSTSFADGTAYKAIVAEYASHALSSLQPPPSTSSPNRSSSASSSTSLTDTISQLGCSRSFTALFRNTSIPSQQTTIPLLAFLASRFLPVSRPVFAATCIQRAWRRGQMRWNLRRRVALAVLARDCATVVTARERIVSAAVKIQRWWRKVVAIYG